MPAAATWSKRCSTAIETGESAVAPCVLRPPDLVPSQLVALAGLGILGIGREAQKLIDANPAAQAAQ